MRVELLWFDGCPNHAATRRVVEQVLASRGLDPAMLESIRVDALSVDRVKFPGSPTIRVNGEDVEPHFRDPGSYSLSCRVYPTAQGLRGRPEIAWVERAIDDVISMAVAPTQNMRSTRHE